MARMIPDHPPAEEVSTKSERDFWRDLKDGLSDEFYVYHGLPYLKGDGSQGECDFLVVHRTHGMLNIECKGWGVDRDNNGNWYRTHPGGRRKRLKQSPTEQATDQIHDIVDELRSPVVKQLEGVHSFPLFFGWALAFPFSYADEMNLPLSLQPELIIDGRDIDDDLEAKVVEAIKFHSDRFDSDRSLDKEQFAKLRSAISPPMSIPAEVMGAMLDRERREILELSERQSEMIRQMLGIPRLRVRGGAGTGKTVLATYGARVLAERGEDVLLTCFNSDLGGYLKNAVAQFDELPGTVDVHHFHELCSMANRDLGDVLDYPDKDASREEKKQFWREETAFTLLRALADDELSVGPWDAVIVDEGQDFAANWWEVLDEGLREPGEGRMVVFYDDKQAIFDREPSVPELNGEFPLFENFRNTVAIAEKVQRLVDVELQPHRNAPDGEPPKVHQQPGPSKTQRLVGELIDKLVDREGIDYRQIAILTPHRPQNSSLEHARELDGHPIVYDLENWTDGVLHSSIGGFKGLEADVVLLVDVDPDDPRCSLNDRYVAASRAVHRLYIFEKGHWLKGV